MVYAEIENKMKENEMESLGLFIFLRIHFSKYTFCRENKNVLNLKLYAR